MALKLYGGIGSGSAPVEAALEMAGLEYEFIQAASWDGPEALARLERVNPLAQVPALVLEDGTVLTESAAVLFWIADRAPHLGLVPAPDDARRPRFLRWMFFVPANLYAMFTIGDVPARWIDGEEAQKALREKATERTKFFWRVMEEALTPAPFVLGSAMTALDLYVATISYWRPGRQWFDAACPKLAAAARETERHPVVAEVWARHFKNRA